MASTQDGTWASYAGVARIELAVVLLVIAGVAAFAGTRLPLPARAARPGRAAIIFMLLTWVLALVTFGVCVAVYIMQVQHEHLAGALPSDPIAPVTAVAAFVTFFVILVTNSEGGGVGLVSALVGAAAGPMIFELPFDLIVMSRTYPAIPPHPAVYRALFFLPLFVIEVLTLWMLTLSPRMKLSRPAFFYLAGMLAVFAVWALFGMAYPSAPIPIALNMVSKVLAFATVLCLFLPLRARASTETQASTETKASTGG
jgi:hypothetical protein